MKTFPLPSTAAPSGALNCPSPLPELPQVVTNGHASMLHTHAQEFPPPKVCPQSCPPLMQQATSRHVPPPGACRQTGRPLMQQATSGHVPPQVGGCEIAQVSSQATDSQEPPPVA